MAFTENIIGGSVPCQADSSVTAITLDSKGNYSSGGIQYGTCVKLNTSGKIGDVVIASTNDHVFGVAITDPAAAPSASVRVARLGIVKVRAGAAVSLGDLVSSDSSGRAVTASAAAATDKWIFGTAMEAATQAEDLISVALSVDAATNVNA